MHERTEAGTFAKVPMETRFWAKVEMGGPDECWMWLGKPDNSGYARITDYWDKWLVHRYSYELHFGPVPEGMQVCHTCDVRLCVNPAHLFLGDAFDNNRDKIDKGRQPVGEQVITAKVTAEIVREMRRRYAAGYVQQTELAEEYGLSQGHVSRILLREAWKHVD